MLDTSEKRQSLWLSRHGGWILLVAGTALLVLSALFSNRPAVAPIFALGGIALVVLGVFLPRIEGAFEFNATGFKFFLAEIGRETRELPPDAKAQVLDSLVESASRRGIPREAEAVDDARRVVEAALGHHELLEAVALWLQGQNWRIGQEAIHRTRGGHFADLIAEKDEELLIVEVKSSLKPIRNYADVRYQLNRIRDAYRASSGRDQSPRVALFLSQAPPANALSRIAGDGFEVWVRDGDGFKKVA
jgi:hypothetical protein